MASEGNVFKMKCTLSLKKLLLLVTMHLVYKENKILRYIQYFPLIALTFVDNY